MSNGKAYGDHFSAYAYKRIELHEDDLFYIKDALSPVSEDCTDAAEFTPALIVDGKKIDTPPKEMELLYHLASTPNRVYTRNQLLDEVWGFDYFGDSRTVDVHVKRLREKVENVSDQWALKTVWGVGYKFEVK